MQTIEVFVINVPHRTDRRRNMEQVLNASGFTNYTFVQPVKVDSLDPRFPNVNTGLLSLQRTVIEKVFPLVKREHFIVFEDDVMCVVPPHEILPRLEDMVTHLPPTWDMLYLEYCMEMCPTFTPEVAPGVYKAFMPHCTASIMYKRSSIPKIIQCIERERKQIDYSYGACIRHRKLDAYLSWPPLYAQDAAIQGEIKTLENDRVLYYLNKVFRLYNTDATHSYPRLPACKTPSALIPYIRWSNVIVIVLIIIMLVFCVAMFR